MPIIAGRASAAYGAGFAAVTTIPFSLVGSFDALGTVTVPSGGLSSITFNGIPQTGYDHLQIRCITRTNRASSQDEYKLNFNSDTSSIYSRHSIVGGGSGTEATGFTGQNHWRAGWMSAATAPANTFGVSVFDILDYTNTNKFKTGRNLTGYDNNGDGTIGFVSGLWRSTDAINRIDITPAFATFQQYSQFALYGVKA